MSLDGNTINVGSFVCCTKIPSFPVGLIKDIGPELDNPNKGDCFAYVQLRNWEVIPVLKSTLVLVKRQTW